MKLKDLMPKNPEIGALWYDSPTSTIRQWDGKKWAELTPMGVRQAVRDICEEDAK